MDTILLLSIFLVFITALLGAFIQRRKRDRVLADVAEQLGHGVHVRLVAVAAQNAERVEALVVDEDEDDVALVVCGVGG